ncbi:MAG: NUDIX hydrolase [Pseudomonadales bacterium]|nr:NUDIX hydrolase [Pseudomonadales bacterium]
MTSNETFSPHVTVATVVCRDDRFLFVEEYCNGQLVLNQPAGHLEANESLVEAAIRETHEETGWRVSITGVLGINLYRAPRNGVTYHRTTFVGQAITFDNTQALDNGIVRALWLTPTEARQHSSAPRSPMVFSAVEQYLDNTVYPLSIFNQ